MGETFNPVVAIEIGQPGALPLRLSSVTPDGGRGLRLGATARLTIGRQDNVTEVFGYGLSEQTVGKIREAGTLCRVLAGWRGRDGTGQPSQIAAGKVLPTTVHGPTLEGADWLTSWSLTDGGLDLRDVIVSESWSGPTKASRVLDRLIAVSGLARGSVVLGTDPQWNSGYVAAGTLRRALAALSRVTRSTITVQDGAIQAWPLGQARYTSGVLLSPTSGLVGDPEPRDNKAWEVRALLIPGCRPGDELGITSRQLTGRVRVIDVVHDVDSEGDACETLLTVRPS